MSIEIKRKEILRLFDENIYPHIMGDLKILDSIQPTSTSSGCTVPTAMLILSALDFIGYSLRQSARQDDTEGNIKSALNHNNYFPGLYDSEVSSTLIFFYRHGIMHSFYPRQTKSKIFGIHKSENSTLLENILSQGFSVTSLNVNVLSKDFRQFVYSLYSEIKVTSNQILLDNIYKSFKITFPENFTNSPTTTIMTTIPYGVISNK